MRVWGFGNVGSVRARVGSLIATSAALLFIFGVRTAQAEYCWAYVAQDAAVPIQCVNAQDPSQTCSGVSGEVCHYGGEDTLNQCCATIPGAAGSQSIQSMHTLWHSCLGGTAIGTQLLPPATLGDGSVNPFAGRVAPPGRGMRWYSMHRQMNIDFDVDRDGTTHGRLEWVPWGADADGNPKRLFHEFPSNPDGSNAICQSTQDAVWRRGSELGEPGPPCEECVQYPDCLNFRPGLQASSGEECASGILQYFRTPAGEVAACNTAASTCRLFSTGEEVDVADDNLEPLTSIDQFTHVEQVTDLLDAYIHGGMHSAVDSVGFDRCSLPPYNECNSDADCATVGPCNDDDICSGGLINGDTVSCRRDEDCGVCIQPGFHEYCGDVGPSTTSVRDPEFWRLHKSLDVTVQGWQRTKPVDIVMVLDMSGSMSTLDTQGTSKFDKAVEAAAMFADAMAGASAGASPQASSNLGIVLYADGVSTAMVLTPAVGLTPEAIRQTLQGVTPAGCTGIGGALREASQMLCGEEGCVDLADRRRGVLLLTDGLENVPPCLFDDSGTGSTGTCGGTCNGPSEDVYTMLGDAQVCTVGFGESAQLNGDRLTLLAERQGGVYYHQPSTTGTQGEFADLKGVFSKCFGLVSADAELLDPGGTLAEFELSSTPVEVGLCSETSAMVLGGWSDAVVPGDLSLLITDPSGNSVRTDQAPIVTSEQDTWTYARLPLPLNGEQPGQWRAELVRPHTSFANGFTTDALDPVVGTQVVRRQIQRLCPNGCEDVLYYEDGRLGPSSSYELALTAEVDSGLLDPYQIATSPTDFEALLLAQPWDLIVYAHQLTSGSEVYDGTLLDVACSASPEGTRMIVTDTRQNTSGRNINFCSGAGIQGEQSLPFNWTELIGDGRIVDGTHTLTNHGYDIFSYGFRKLSVDRTCGGGYPETFEGDVYGYNDAGTYFDYAAIGSYGDYGNCDANFASQAWFVEVTFQGDSLALPHSTVFDVRTTQGGLVPSVRLLPTHVPEGGYDAVSATVTVRAPAMGTGQFLTANGLGSDITLGGETVEGRAAGLFAQAFPTLTHGPYVLNDDGVDGDQHPGNYYYSGLVPNLGDVDGMYQFQFDLELTKNGCTSQRQVTQSVYVDVGIDLPSSSVSVDPGGGGEGPSVTLIPRDPFGNPWGPGRVPSVSCSPLEICDCDASDVVDNGDGSFTIDVNVVPGGAFEDCTINTPDSWDVDIPVDNCVGIANPDQTDSDGDGIGDPCELAPDAGADQVVECAGDGTASVTLDGSGSQPAGLISYEWSSSASVDPTDAAISTGEFPLGTTSATLTITRGAESESDTVTVTVEDTTGPELILPANVFAETCSANLDVGVATATDACGGAVALTNDAPADFPAGVTFVTWTAVDQFGNETVKVQTVVVGVGDDPSCCPVGYNVILGSPNNDTLWGTAGPDCILGLGAQDNIFGVGGNDIVSGGQGDDFIGGGAGNDLVQGGPGQDVLYGSFGNDTILGGDGDDDIVGGLGNDTLIGGQGQDDLRGEEHDDQLFGSDGDDLLDGGPGDDALDGGANNDQCFGGTGTNTFYSCQNEPDSCEPDCNESEQCGDNALNGNETDVDCGGDECPACPNGSDCLTNTDCQSGVCSSNACQAVTSSVFDFESGTQGWTGFNAPVNTATTTSSEAFDGLQSLTLVVNGNGQPEVWTAVGQTITGGTQITFRVFMPNGAPIYAVTPYVQDANWGWTDSWNFPVTLGSWQTYTVTVPPGALMPTKRLGVRFHMNGSYNGTLHVDAVDW